MPQVGSGPVKPGGLPLEPACQDRAIRVHCRMQKVACRFAGVSYGKAIRTNPGDFLFPVCRLRGIEPEWSPFK